MKNQIVLVHQYRKEVAIVDKYPSIRRSSLNGVVLYMTDVTTGIVLDSANSRNPDDGVGNYLDYWNSSYFGESIEASEYINLTSQDFNTISKVLEGEPENYSDHGRFDYE